MSPHFIELDYVLIRFEGADLSALTYDGDSPSLMAYAMGWWSEWVIALDRSGLDPDVPITQDGERVLEEKSNDSVTERVLLSIRM